MAHKAALGAVLSVVLILGVSHPVAVQTYEVSLGTSHFSSDVSRILGWSGAGGASIGIPVTKRLDVSVGVIRAIEPEMQSMRTLEHLDQYSRREVAWTLPVLAHWKLNRFWRIQPALTGGLAFESVTRTYWNVDHGAGGVSGRQDEHSNSSVRSLLSAGLEASIDLGRKVSLVPQVRFEAYPYADADADVTARYGVGIRWKF